MPRHILKPRSADDFYVEWSTIVDAPITWGNREHIEVRAEWNGAMMARVEATGTSDPYGYGSWDRASQLQVREVGLPFPIWVNSADLRAFCEWLETDPLTPKEVGVKTVFPLGPREVES